MEKVALVVGTCDRYSDTWPSFIHFFEKHVVSAETVNLYVVCESIVPDWKYFTPLRVEPGAIWSVQIRSALDQLDEKFVLWIQDDYWIIKDLDFSTITVLAENMSESGIDYLRLVPIPPAEAEPIVQLDEFTFGTIPTGTPYRRSLQAAIWRKEHFTKELTQDCTPWEFEVNPCIDCGIHYSLTSTSTIPFHYLATAVVKGKWSVAAQRIARTNGLKLGQRKRATVVEEWIRSSRWFQYAGNLKYNFGKALSRWG